MINLALLWFPYMMRPQSMVAKPVHALAGDDSSDEELDVVLDRARALEKVLPPLTDKYLATIVGEPVKPRRSFEVPTSLAKRLAIVHGRRPSLATSTTSSGETVASSCSSGSSVDLDDYSLAATMPVLDQHGVAHAFCDILSPEGKTVVIFIRNYWCGLCMTYVEKMAKL
jgi:hypothetical protein